MNKRLVLLGMVIWLAASLAACATNRQNGDLPSAPSPSPTTTQGTTPTPTPTETYSPLEYEVDGNGIITPESARANIEALAKQVITLIAERNFEALADLVHPERGVRFTPYTNVNPERDLVFTQEQIRHFFRDETAYTWGQYDGSGEDIVLTPAQYYERFIYSADFAHPERIGYNEVLGSGNIAENQFEVYENAIVVEYYFSGFNPDYAGSDWQSLRLVFQPHENQWRLAGVIHNEWTI